MPQHDEERKAEINSTKVSNDDSVCLLFGDFVVLCLRTVLFLSLVFVLTLNRAKFQLLSLFVQHNLDKVLLFFDLQFLFLSTIVHLCCPVHTFILKSD